MPIDPSIALQTQPLKLDSPLDSAGKAMSLRQLMLQNESAQQGIDDTSRLRGIYQQGASNPATLRDLLYKGGFPDKALALDKDVIANNKATSDIGYQTAQTEKIKNELRAQISGAFLSLPPEQRQTAWPQVAQRWNSLGLSSEGAPPAPDQWNDNLLPHIEVLAKAGMTPDQIATRQDEADLAPKGPVLRQPTSPQDVTDSASGAVLRQPNLAQPQGVAIAANEAPTIDVNGRGPAETPEELRRQAMGFSAKGTKAGRDAANQLRQRADALDANIRAEQKASDELVEVGDQSSPTGSRWVKKSEAAGLPGSKKLAASNVQVNVKASEESNKDFLTNEFRPSVNAGNQAKDSNARIAAFRSLPITDKTGWGTETKAKAAAVLGALGIKDAEKYASDAQVFNAQVKQRVFEVLGAQKGVQTEGDASRAEQTYVALGKTPQANEFLMDMAQATNSLALKKAEFYLQNKKRGLDSGDLGQLETEWFDKSKDMSIWKDPVMKKWLNSSGSAPGKPGWSIKPLP